MMSGKTGFFLQISDAQTESIYAVVGESRKKNGPLTAADRRGHPLIFLNYIFQRMSAIVRVRQRADFSFVFSQPPSQVGWGAELEQRFSQCFDFGW
jgi:hypothetical protein